jgi:threonine dehydrogenase-like Zn-dependent dehydrogenase
MRALVVRPPAPSAHLVDVPPPSMGPDEVRVHVLECGVCGTDHDIVEGQYGQPPAGTPDLILGHENLGRVLEVGASVRGWAPGQLVVATVRRSCNECRFCRSGQSDFCETGRYTERGIFGRSGYMAEQYVDSPEYLVAVPEELRSVAVMLEPMSVAEKAIVEGQRSLDRKEPTPGYPPTRPPTALVAGTGAIGILASLILRLRGYTVSAIDRHDSTTPAGRILEQMGVRHVNAAGGISALGSDRFDLIVEATGAIALDIDLLGLLAINGVLVLTGIPDAHAPPIPVAAGAVFRQMVLSNQAVVGSVNANRSYFESGVRDFTEAHRRWPGLLEKLVTRRHPLEEFLDVLGHREGGAIKNVLVVDPRG